MPSTGKATVSRNLEQFSTTAHNLHFCFHLSVTSAESKSDILLRSGGLNREQKMLIPVKKTSRSLSRIEIFGRFGHFLTFRHSRTVWILDRDEISLRTFVSLVSYRNVYLILSPLSYFHKAGLENLEFLFRHKARIKFLVENMKRDRARI